MEFLEPYVCSTDDSSTEELSIGSLDSVDLFCEPCLAEGKHFDVVGYCEDCQDYLCDACYKVHNIPLPSRSHRLVNGNQIPEMKPESNAKNEWFNRCALHRSRNVEYLCLTHDKFECAVCVTLKHRTCNVDYIQTLAKKFLESSEYLMMKHNLESLTEKAKHLDKTAKKNIDDVKTNAEKNLNDIRKFRKELNEYFDKIEKQMIDKTKDNGSLNKVKMHGLIKQNNNLMDEIRRLQTDLSDIGHKDKDRRLYIQRQQIRTKIKRFQNELSELEKETGDIDHEQFHRSSKLVSCMNDPTTKLGTVVRKENSFSAGNDQASITDVDFLSERHIVVLDYFTNSVVKVIDAHLGTVISSLNLTEDFWRLARLSEREFFLFSEGTLQIFSVTEKIKLTKTIYNVKLRWPIVYSNETFTGITDTRPYMIRTVNMHGNILRTIDVRGIGKAVLRNPWSIAANSGQTAVYVTDCKTKTVTCITYKGEVKGQYKPKSSWEPRGAAVSRDGTVYVCDHLNNNIVILTPELDTVGVINGEAYDIHHPGAITYCQRGNKLCVAESGGPKLTVLKI